MHIICVEGCHGSGKSSLCERMRAAGYDVLDEAFVGMEHFGLDPQSLIIESFWVTGWFRRLLEMQQRLGGRDACADSVFIADRSPYSASFYARATLGPVLHTLAEGMIAELRSCGIHVHTVHVRVRDDLLWQRISERLVAEPHRRRFNEHERAWMDAIVGAYAQRTWDAHIENNDASLDEACTELTDTVAALVHHATTGSSASASADASSSASSVDEQAHGSDSGGARSAQSGGSSDSGYKTPDDDDDDDDARRRRTLRCP